MSHFTLKCQRVSPSAHVQDTTDEHTPQIFILALRRLPRGGYICHDEAPEDLMSFWESSYKREPVEDTFPTGTIAFRTVFESKRLRSRFGSRCWWGATRGPAWKGLFERLLACSLWGINETSHTSQNQDVCCTITQYLFHLLRKLQRKV